MKVAFVNGKGGVGKTTAAIMIAATLREAGHKVWIDDRDPQGSATLLAPNLGLSLGRAEESTVMIIDTAPRLDHTPTIAAIQEADIVVLVCSPSPADLGTTVQTASIVSKYRNGPTVILLNSVVKNTRLARNVTDLNLPFPTLANVITRRQVYQIATLQGWVALTSEAREELFRAALEIVSAYQQVSR